MKNYKLFLSISLIFIAIITSGFAINRSEVPDAIVKALQKGDAESLAGFFNRNVELVLLANDAVCSSAQAKQMIADFFRRNAVTDFVIIQEGGKTGQEFAIGNLKSSTGVYRVFFRLKLEGGHSYIHQLRIEYDEK